MFDRFRRDIHYLRISVTNRCNLRCVYCMPAEGIELKARGDILTYEEIEEAVRTAVKLGFRKVRLTGGEPLVRRDIVHCVRRLAAVGGLEFLAMTTNGLLLPVYARELKAAGLSRLNISLDSLKPDRYRQITRGGELVQALAAIRAAKEAGFEGTKLNVVLVEGLNDDEKEAFRSFAEEHRLEIRFIHRMNLKTGEFRRVEGGDGGRCSVCNRLRLTADGKLRCCLFSDLEFDIRKEGIEQAFINAIQAKPQRGQKSSGREMVEIGG